MEKKNYSVLTTKRAATPRSERGRTQTQRAASIITVVGGDAEDGSAGSGHMHDNKEVIDSLRADSQSDYLYIRKIPAGQDPVNCKVSAGKADDATQWNGHSFDEYLDQKVRRIDAVEFASVKVGDSVFSKLTQTARAAVGMAAQYALSLFDKIGANSILLRLFRLHADHVTVEESLTSSDFGQDGFTGKGFGLTKDSSGRWVLETDKLVVRRSLNVNEVVINQISHIGGRTIYSSANMECARVEEIDGVYRCYLDTENGRRRNLFVAGDQAYCQHFDPASNNVIRYYWRLVTGVGVDYIDLSKSVADTGSDTPASGDMIVQIGHRANTGADPDAYTHRQAMLEINQSDGGHVIQYAGIDSFDFDDKGQVGFGYDASRKRAKMFVHGDIFFGDKVIDPELNPDATFITYQRAEGDARPRVHIQADMNFTDKSTGLSNLSDFQTLDQKANAAQDTASKAQIAANQALSEAVNIVADYNARFALQQVQIDGEVSNWYYPYTPTPKNAPANSWSGADFDERDRHIGDTFLNTQSFAFNPDNVNEWERGGSYGSTLYPWEGDNKDGSSYRIRTPQMLRVSGIVKMSVSIGKVIAYYATTPNGNLTGNSDWKDAVSVNEKDHPYVAFAVKMDDVSIIYPTDIVNMIGLFVEGNMSHVDTGKAWRWIKNGDVYSWTPIADSDAVKALQDSAKAQSTADGKSTTFVLTGTKTPNIYRYGDMWVLQSDTIHAPHKSGEVLFSTTNRTNQYVSGDWVTKVRYTDDSGANEAKAVAVKAQDTADAAKARTDAAATDGLIAIEEKLQLKRDLDSIVKETEELVVIASASGIAQSFVTNLNRAKEGIVGYMNVTMGLNSMTSDTLLLPNYTDAFATLMATYTKRVQELSNAISQKQVDNVQIGGTNLISNMSINWEQGSFSESKPVGSTVDQMKYSSQIVIRPKELLLVDDICTIQAKPGFLIAYTLFDANKKYIGLSQGFQTWITAYPPHTSSRVKYIWLIVKKADDSPILAHQIGDAFIKVETGNKATGWSPAPQDVQAEINAAKDAAVTANAAINAMNDDGIFDIVEKQTIRTQWEAISGVANTSGTPSNAAGASYSDTWNAASKVSIAQGDLDTRFNELRNFLNGLNLYASSNTANFNRAAMAAKFTAYYSAETTLWDKISTKYIDNVQVGGVNLINGSKPAIPWTGNSGKYALKAWTSPSNSYIKKGKTYTVVAELYVDASFVDGGGRGIQFFVGGMQSIDPVFKYTTPTVISTTFTANRDGYLDAYHMPNGTGGNSYINWVKLVEGNKASLDWLESPADMQSKIDKVQANVDDYKYLKTILSGMVVSGSAATLTGLLGVTSMDSGQETKIVGGLTSGFYTKDDTVTNLPMLFSGADGLTDAFRAKLILTGEGMFRVRRGSNAVTIHEGEMSLQTLVGDNDLETTKVLISRRVYTTFDGGVNTVNHFQSVSAATDIYDVPVHWLTHYSENDSSATEISNRFSVGVNASVTIRDIVCELRFPLGTTGKMEFNLQNVSTGLFQSNPLKVNIVGSAQAVVTTVTGKTFTQVPQGFYKLVIRTLEVKHPTAIVRGSVVIKQTSLPMRISNVVSQVPVQLFGQGILCTQDATHYAGMMKQGVMEVRNGDHGLRVDDAGIARRGKSRQWDYSGMLCAGKITATSGYIFPQFGIVECTGRKMPDGNLKIVHNLGHTNYIVTATPYGDPAWNKLHVVVVNKGTTAFELRTVDSGTGNTNAPRDIDFMIYGVW